ncbi:MAG: hypothetical protein ACLTRS_05870 [Lachnospiraceae bacterium]
MNTLVKDIAYEKSPEVLRSLVVEHGAPEEFYISKSLYIGTDVLKNAVLKHEKEHPRVWRRRVTGYCTAV